MSGKIITVQEQEYNKKLGAILRRRREFLGITQYKVAKYIGITHQQYQKYEAGENVVSAYRLEQIKQILEL